MAATMQQMSFTFSNQEIARLLIKELDEKGLIPKGKYVSRSNYIPDHINANDWCIKLEIEPKES